MGKLTVKKVESLTEPGRYSDGDGTGFHLRIDGQGRKYWVLRLSDGGGARRDINIGSVRQMSLSVAREKARQRRGQVEDTGKVEETPDFNQAAKLAHTARTEGYRNEKHVTQWLSTLVTHAGPLIGEKPIDEITRADVVRVLTPIWLATPETARRVLQRIDRVMRWAVGNNHRAERIDMDLVRDALPRQPKRRSTVRRMPSVPWREAPQFWGSIALSTAAPVIRLALSFQILTASRPGNVRLAKRSQFNLDTGVWSIPADEMKAGEPHQVPLSTEAINIVRAVMAMHNHDLLFTMSGDHISLDTLRMMMRRMGRTETPHGFRSTFKEWARASGWNDATGTPTDATITLNFDTIGGASPPDIGDVHQHMTADQTAYLDWAGTKLAASTAALTGAVKTEHPEAETFILIYLPTILDAASPEVRRANVPVGWAKPAFDRLQLEDYDWVTDDTGKTAAGVAAATDRLGYPIAEQNYFSGFVLNAADADDWALIDAAAENSRVRGTEGTYFWALPQVMRDGFVHSDRGLYADAFVNGGELWTIAPNWKNPFSVSYEFKTDIFTSRSGKEQRRASRSTARKTIKFLITRTNTDAWAVRGGSGKRRKTLRRHGRRTGESTFLLVLCSR